MVTYSARIINTTQVYMYADHIQFLQCMHTYTHMTTNISYMCTHHYLSIGGDSTVLEGRCTGAPHAGVEAGVPLGGLWTVVVSIDREEVLLLAAKTGGGGGGK